LQLLYETGGFNYLEGSLASSVHTGGHRVEDVFSPPASLLALVAWIRDMEVKLYVYVFAPDFATAQQSWHRGGYQLCPVDDTSILGFS
jgi:hypothetical protein